MYEKTHAAIREDPERKPSDKEPFKGKRYVAFHLYSGFPLDLENLEISWNFENFNKYHGHMT